eukprot:12889607-Prorocentrum_lima.AAC.1
MQPTWLTIALYEPLEEKHPRPPVLNCDSKSSLHKREDCGQLPNCSMQLPPLSAKGISAKVDNNTMLP